MDAGMSEEGERKRESVRRRARAIKSFRCKKLIAVLENPKDIANIGSVIRNVNALGVEKVYVVAQEALPDDWQNMRERVSLLKTSASAVKWSFVKRFDSTESCIRHLEENGFVSIVTSPHIKGKENAILDEVDFTKYPKLAVWFGTESRGGSTKANIVRETRELQSRKDKAVLYPYFSLSTTSVVLSKHSTAQKKGAQKIRHP